MLDTGPGMTHTPVMPADNATVILDTTDLIMDAQTQDARHTFGTTLGVDRMQTAQGFVVRLTNTGVAVGRIYRYTSAEPWTVRVGVVEAETTGSLDAALAAFEDRIDGAAERRMGA